MDYKKNIEVKRFGEKDSERLSKEAEIKMKKMIREDKQVFERMLKSSIKARKEWFENRIYEIKKSLNIEEKCPRCTWSGPRKNTAAIEKQWTHFFFIACPACERTIRENLTASDSWRL